MSATEAPDCESRGGEDVAPTHLVVEFARGPMPSFRACELDLSSWSGGPDGEGMATIALLHPDGIALHIGQTPDDLRSLAAAALRAAALLDGGGSVQ